MEVGGTRFEVVWRFRTRRKRRVVQDVGKGKQEKEREREWITLKSWVEYWGRSSDWAEEPVPVHGDKT